MTRKRSQRLDTLIKLRHNEESDRQRLLTAARDELTSQEQALADAREAVKSAEARLGVILGQPSLDLNTLQRARADLEAVHSLERRLRLALREVTRRVGACQRDLKDASVARRAAEELQDRASSEERLVSGRSEVRASDEASVLRWEGGAA